MAGSVNKVILVGNLGRDPEVRTLPSGDRVVSFSVATSESWRDRNTGERRERTEWHNVSIFNENLAKIAEQYCRKGSKIYLEGQLQTREYQDKDGIQRRATDVVLQRFRGELALLDSRGGGAGAGDYEGGGGGYGSSSGGGSSFGRSSPMERSSGDRAPAPAPAGGGRLSDQLDDDIPF
ncbi:MULTISPECIES: single-stranded DNA-binding protein [Methylosinus]|uniref:Single-stranded DNA-binding protein n=1 Tax=Methylosinus trichosporium (strain ATCC 35070 / NCIMB 11131 / UNIQEM 75 / OB3b) TaxID=595536 RepID=A0A2D2CWZ1_METT3|nr:MULTISPECIES: single-stranded DNA-binding protein [Methylosinus]ATQ67255.1 single-stranded DNA-binding protein [Methylosinus trichosporium OB3b]OBS52573.1 single-stranded DNA-binding protein [Methylosinus sp. 3S-1]